MKTIESGSYPDSENFTVATISHPVKSTFLLGSWAFKGSLAVLDQGLIAASNFVTSIFLARWLSPEQYGSYALAFAIFLFLSLAYQALLLEPQRIFGPSEYIDSQREYLGVLLTIHAGLALAILLVLGIAAWLIHTLALPNNFPSALAGLTFAAPCVLLLWLARGAFYVLMSPQYAVKGAAVYCAVMLGGLCVIYRFKWLSPFSAFLLMGLAALGSSAVLLNQLNPILRTTTSNPSWRLVLQQNWNYGRWILLSSILSWVTTDIYYPVVSSFSGMADAGALKALLNFSLPVTQTFSALSIFALPYASRVHQEKGLPALAGLVSRMTWLFIGLGIAYWAVLIVLSKNVLRAIYAGRYTELSTLVPLVAAASLPWNVIYVPTIALRAVRSSTSVLFVYAVCSAVTLLIGIPGAWAFGLRGALWAMILSNSTGLVVAFTILNRKRTNVSRAQD